NLISTTEQTVESPSAISDAAVPTTPFSPYGTWSGVTLLNRQQLWQAALVYAQSTLPGDPGPAYMYRNYNDLSWFYWLPSTANTGAAANGGLTPTDPRIQSTTFNRFRGYT